MIRQILGYFILLILSQLIFSHAHGADCDNYMAKNFRARTSIDDYRDRIAHEKGDSITTYGARPSDCLDRRDSAAFHRLVKAQRKRNKAKGLSKKYRSERRVRTEALQYVLLSYDKPGLTCKDHTRGLHCVWKEKKKNKGIVFEALSSDMVKKDFPDPVTDKTNPDPQAGTNNTAGAPTNKPNAEELNSQMDKLQAQIDLIKSGRCDEDSSSPSHSGVGLTQDISSDDRIQQLTAQLAKIREAQCASLDEKKNTSPVSIATYRNNYRNSRLDDSPGAEARTATIGEKRKARRPAGLLPTTYVRTQR